MKHKVFFSGSSIDLDQNADAIKSDFQTALDKFYPTPNSFVKVHDYNEINSHSFVLILARQYANGAGISLGNKFICDQDESLITGLDISAFQPFEPGQGLVAPMVPWNDNMVYTPIQAFSKLWIQLNKAMTKERIKEITVSPMVNEITIQVIFA